MGRFGTVAALLWFAAPVYPAAHPEAGSVLILVNDNAPPEDGTNGQNASVWVGEYYAAQRGIPKQQILHLNIPMACCPTSLLDWDNWNMDWLRFDSGIRQPLLRYLSDPANAQIRYIVTTYGIPLRTWDSNHRVEGLSIDSLIAGIRAGSIAQFLPNPYYSQWWNEGRVRFRNFTNPAGWQMYIVSRLDGPSAKIAAGLVDKAIRAEANLNPDDGTGYFDFRHIVAGDPYYPPDVTVQNAYDLARARGYRSVFNDNGSDNDRMIHSAPKTLWAWGWYSGPFAWTGYEFLEGAVGAQLTSYTANSIRTMMPGTWVTLWLNAGITATWGATNEPYTIGYANGDNLFDKFWSGYNFGESAYLASPFLNHSMVFVGDPLYAPRVFQPARPALDPAGIVSAAVAGGGTLAPGAIATLRGAGLSLCTASNRTASLPKTLCGTSVTINGVPAPLFYVSGKQINVLVPRGITAGEEVRITLSREDGQTAAAVLPAGRFAGAAPAIFTANADGVDTAIVQDARGQLAALKPGDAGVLYAAGLGRLDGTLDDSAAAPFDRLLRAVGNVKVWVNGAPQQTLFAGLTPGQFGLFQVNFVLDPAFTPADGGANFIWLTVDGVESVHVRVALAPRQ